MIFDLNLKVPSLKEKMLWFKGNINYYIVGFSDDVAPESCERTLTTGTISLWSFCNRIRSRDFHYLLHTISASEKDKVGEFLWMQHCDEMQLIEGNVIVINGVTCTFQFYPSADTAWLYFACNELSCSATNPSPFAQVHKNDLSQMNDSIGNNDKCTLKVPFMKSREKDLKILETF